MFELLFVYYLILYAIKHTHNYKTYINETNKYGIKTYFFFQCKFFIIYMRLLVRQKNAFVAILISIIGILSSLDFSPPPKYISCACSSDRQQTIQNETLINLLNECVCICCVCMLLVYNL